MIMLLSDDLGTTAVLLAQHEGDLLRQLPAHCYPDGLHGSGLHALSNVRKQSLPHTYFGYDFARSNQIAVFSAQKPIPLPHSLASLTRNSTSGITG